MRNIPSNTDDVIDSRDVIERIEELENERTALVEALAGAKETLTDAEDDTSVFKNNENVLAGLRGELEEAETAITDWDESDEASELEVLKALAEEAEGETSGWSDGVTLINEDYFTEYAQDLVRDIGYLPSNLPGYIVIDWGATADNLKEDYSTVDFDRETYYIQNS